MRIFYTVDPKASTPFNEAVVYFRTQALATEDAIAAAKNCADGDMDEGPAKKSQKMIVRALEIGTPSKDDIIDMLNGRDPACLGADVGDMVAQAWTEPDTRKEAPTNAYVTIVREISQKKGLVIRTV